MKSDNNTHYFHLAFAYYNVTMQNTILYFSLTEFLSELSELGYASIVTIVILVELHLPWLLGSKVPKQKIMYSQNHP